MLWGSAKVLEALTLLELLYRNDAFCQELIGQLNIAAACSAVVECHLSQQCSVKTPPPVFQDHGDCQSVFLATWLFLLSLSFVIFPLTSVYFVRQAYLSVCMFAVITILSRDVKTVYFSEPVTGLPKPVFYRLPKGLL